MKRSLVLFLTFFGVYAAAQIEPDTVFPRLMAHVPKFEAGFQATILLKNDSDFTKEVYFNCFDEQGELLNLGNSAPFRIPKRTTLSLNGQDALPPGTSHFTVVGSNRVRVSTVYGRANTDEAAKALLHENDQAGRRFSIVPTGGNPEQGYWEGLAIINLSNQRATVTFSLRNFSGGELANADLVLKPMAKHVSLLGDLFTSETPKNLTQIEVASDQPVNIVMLSGNSIRDDITNVSPEPLVQLESLLLTEDIEALPKKLLSLETVQFDEEVLTISGLVPNPCHELELYWNGGIKESFPPQVDIYVVARQVTEICFQPITKRTRSFDLTQIGHAFLQSGGADGETIIVNLRDKDHSNIVSTYNFIPQK